MLLTRLSPKGVDRLARTCAVCAFDLLRFRRRMILLNLAIAFGSERSKSDRIRMSRESMYHFMLTCLEFLRSVRYDMKEHMTLHDGERAQEALKQGRGFYILIAHLGNWEAMGGAGVFFGIPTHCIVKALGSGSANRFVDELRIKNGLQTIHRDPPGAALRAIRSAMKRNEAVAFILDQARPGAPRIPFFGTPAKTQTSLAAIWRKHPAPILPVYCKRTGVGRHDVFVLPPLDLEKTDDMEADILRITGQCNQSIEAMIRQCPEQYFWMHNRWKK